MSISAPPSPPDTLHLCFEGGNRQRVQVSFQRGQIVLRVTSHVGRVDRLLPLPALHGDAPPPPGGHDLLDSGRVAQGVVLAEEEQGRRRDGAVVEHLDAAAVKVCRAAFEEPEVKHGGGFHQALQTGHQGLTEACGTTERQ